MSTASGTETVDSTISQQAKPHLLTLPAELRDRIYEFLIADNHFHVAHRGDRREQSGTGLDIIAYPSHHPHPAATRARRKESAPKDWESVLKSGRLVREGCFCCEFCAL